MGSIKKKNNGVYFAILFFILYILLTFVSDLTFGRKVKGALIYGTLFLSICCSLLTIVYMIVKREFDIYKIILTLIPIFYLVIIILI